MTVTVAMPYFGAPRWVNRAARSVLAQDHRDLRLVVIGDGEAPPLEADVCADPRVVVYQLAENRGTYFATQVALLATPDPWFAIVAADDWIEPDHISQLISIANGGATAIPVGGTWEHASPADRSGRHRGRRQIVGMYATERLRGIGGFDPAERLSQDTLVLLLLTRFGGVTEAPRPTYHWMRHSGSLTRSPATSHHSPARVAARVRWRTTWLHCRHLRDPSQVRDHRQALIPPAIAAEVDHHAAALRAILS